jgi:hypothetical protein
MPAMPGLMKLRDALLLVGIVGGLALMFVVSRHGRGERVKPGSPEYAAYIDAYVAECLQKPWVREPGAAAGASPSPAEREAACRAFVLQADRFNPGARPFKSR